MTAASEQDRQMRRANKVARRTLARHAKSFWWAARLLPAWCRRDAAALYAWCRRCDDAVDLPTDVATARAAVRRMRAELDNIYCPIRSQLLLDPVLSGFRDVVRRHAIPRRHADDLIDGMAMDVGTVRYRTFDDLLLYCYRVAGTVGLMMARVMDVRDPVALRRAADLGIAMQLTNISRDVAEDERRDRLYLPAELAVTGGRPTAAATSSQKSRTVAELLRRANGFYASGDRGLAALPLRCAVAIRAARLIYAEIGVKIARRGFDVYAGRAVVPRWRKLWLVLRALMAAPAMAWRRLPSRSANATMEIVDEARS